MNLTTITPPAPKPHLSIELTREEAIALWKFLGTFGTPRNFIKSRVHDIPNFGGQLFDALHHTSIVRDHLNFKD